MESHLLRRFGIVKYDVNQRSKRALVGVFVSRAVYLCKSNKEASLRNGYRIGKVSKSLTRLEFFYNDSRVHCLIASLGYFGIARKVSYIESETYIEVVKQSSRKRLAVASVPVGNSIVVDIYYGRLADGKLHIDLSGDILYSYVKVKRVSAEQVEVGCKAYIHTEIHTRKGIDYLCKERSGNVDGNLGIFESYGTQYIFYDIHSSIVESRICGFFVRSNFYVSIAVFSGTGKGRQTAVCKQIVDYLVEVKTLNVAYDSVKCSEQFRNNVGICDFNLEESETFEVNHKAVTVDVYAEYLLALIGQREHYRAVCRILKVEIPLYNEFNERVPVVKVESDRQLESASRARENIIDKLGEVHLVVESLQINLCSYRSLTYGIDYRLNEVGLICLEFAYLLSDIKLSIADISYYNRIFVIAGNKGEGHTASVVVFFASIIFGSVINLIAVFISARQFVAFGVVIVYGIALSILHRYQFACKIEFEAVLSAHLEAKTEFHQAQRLGYSLTEFCLSLRKNGKYSSKRYGCVYLVAVETEYYSLQLFFRHFGSTSVAGRTCFVCKICRSCRRSVCAFSGRLVKSEKLYEVKVKRQIAVHSGSLEQVTQSRTQQIVYQIGKVEREVELRQGYTCYLEVG